MMDLIKVARSDKIPWNSECREPVYHLPDLEIPQGMTWEDIDDLTITNLLEWEDPTGGAPLSLTERYEALQPYLGDVRGEMVHPVYKLADELRIDDLQEVIGSTSKAFYLRDPENKQIYQLDKSRTKLVI